MKSVREHVVFTTEVNRSKFIAHLLPMAEAEGLQEKLKQEHPKANHVVYASRYINAFDQIVEKSSDDGEPKGCAGTPALNVLRGEELINCVVFIVRYFGGIKLGTGGMARAYAAAAKEVIIQADLVPYEKEICYTFTTDYSSVERVLYRLKGLGITRIERSFGIEEVHWTLTASERLVSAFKEY
jgi:uncharacterized YigZ family protein